MKHYILLTPGIKDMGGSQVYTKNKMEYLKKQGYSVSVFHSGAGKGLILIEELTKFQNNNDFHILYPAYLFQKQERERVIELICKNIPEESEIIIESHSIACAVWGELAAKKTKAKHIVYLLSEYNSIRNIQMYKFFKFKLERRELAGITNKTITLLFRKWEDLDENNANCLIASCTNVVEDIPYPMMDKIPKSDFTIGSIGRINKLFINDMLDDFIHFVNKFPEKRFTMVFIGGEPKESKNKRIIEQKFQNVTNVSLFFTGYLYPIPKELVFTPDAFISSAGSCLVSSSLGVPTISIDSNDHKPIGIIGETTNNNLFRENEINESLYDLLFVILFKKLYTKQRISDSRENQFEFSEHLQFLHNSENHKSYFSFKNVRFSLIDWIEKISFLVFGDRRHRTFSMKLLPLWKRIRDISAG